MANLEALSRTLNTVTELGEVVRTMKTLSAVSIRQCERAVEALADYDAAVEFALAAVLAELPAQVSQPTRPGSNTGLVLLGSDHGLCGRFNEALVEAVTAGESTRATHRVLAVGERVGALWAATEYAKPMQLGAPSAVTAFTGTVSTVLGVLADWRECDDVQQVRLWHNRSVDAEPHRAVALGLLPQPLETWRTRPWPSASRRPGLPRPAPEMLEPLLEEQLYAALYRALAESLSSEHQSRLLAMQTAEHNISERLTELNGEYRQARQEAVTSELLDLVAGFEAMGGH
jgi:F-type H+-transporting ATPase subunit gamma